MKSRLLGVSDMIKTFKRIQKEYPDKVVAKAVMAEGNIEMRESKKRCPVETDPTPPDHRPGTLRDSGRVDLDHSDNRYIAVLSYGGEGSGAEDYAVVQHERLDYHHEIGEAKYLESVLNESRSSMNSRLARRLSFNDAGVVNAIGGAGKKHPTSE